MAHDSPNYGYIFASGLLPENHLSKLQMLRRIGCSEDEFDTLFEELKAAGVPSFDGVLVYSRRMVRDASLRAARACAGRKGGKQKKNFASRLLTTRAPSKTQANTEDENEIEKEDEKNLTSSSEDPIERVVSHYQKYYPRARPGKTIRMKISRRLKDGYSAQDLCDAIDGNHISPYHCGENEQNTEYHSLGLIVRDSDHVDQFLNHKENPPSALSTRTMKTIRAGEQFLDMKMPDFKKPNTPPLVEKK